MIEVTYTRYFELIHHRSYPRACDVVAGPIYEDEVCTTGNSPKHADLARLCDIYYPIAYRRNTAIKTREWSASGAMGSEVIALKGSAVMLMRIRD